MISSYELSLSGCSLAGDYNCDGTADRPDYTLWKNTFGSTGALAADGNLNGAVDATDYTVWRDHLGAAGGGSMSNSAVPEPAAQVIAFVGVAGALVGWHSGLTRAGGFPSW